MPETQIVKMLEKNHSYRTFIAGTSGNNPLVKCFAVNLSVLIIKTPLFLSGEGSLGRNLWEGELVRRWKEVVNFFLIFFLEICSPSLFFFGLSLLTCSFQLVCSSLLPLLPAFEQVGHVACLFHSSVGLLTALAVIPWTTDDC